MENTRYMPTSLKVILALTVITTFAWIGFDVYRAFTQLPPPVVSEEILAPVEPNLNVNVLNALPNRVYLNNQ